MSVTSRLVDVQGGKHVVRVGDVGDGEFWRGLRREVCSVDTSFLGYRNADVNQEAD